jgi:hypothetical protein
VRIPYGSVLQVWWSVLLLSRSRANFSKFLRDNRFKTSGFFQGDLYFCFLFDSEAGDVELESIGTFVLSSIDLICN